MQDKQPSTKQMRRFLQEKAWFGRWQEESTLERITREVKDTIAGLKEVFGISQPTIGQPVRVPVVVNDQATVRRNRRYR